MKSPTEIYGYLSSIISAAPYGILAIDLDGEVTLLNERALKYLEVEQKIKKVIETKFIFYLDHLPELQELLSICLKRGRENFDLSLQSPKKRYLSVRGRQILNGMILTIEDITAYKAVETATLNAMLEGQEKERRRLAQEIHDGIGPVLSAIKMNLDNVQEEVIAVAQERTQGHFFTVQKLLKSVTQDLRGISHDLMPSALEDFGLTSAFENLCSNVKQNDSTSVQCLVTGDIQRLDAKLELAIYRIGQELLHNALKYAQATSITLQLIKHPKSVVLVVEDDGIGFKQENIIQKKGIGLRNIATRVKSLNGTFLLDTIEGSGTVVTIEIPVLTDASQ